MSAIMLLIIVNSLKNEKCHNYHYESHDGNPYISVSSFYDCCHSQGDFVFEICYINPPDHYKIVQYFILQIYMRMTKIISLEMRLFIRNYLANQLPIRNLRIEDIYVRVCPGILKPENFLNGPASSFTYSSKNSIGIKSIRIKIDNDLLEPGWNTIVVFPVMITNNGFPEFPLGADFIYTYYQR